MKKFILLFLLLIPINVLALEYELDINLVDYNTNTCRPYNDADLSTAEYIISDGSIERTIEFDENCNTKIKLDEGNYNIYQKNPGIGYVKEKNNTNVVLNSSKSIIIKNNIIRSSINFYKYFVDKSFPYKNTSFEIYYNSKKIGVSTTDENGYFYANLRYGSYTFKQINTYLDYPIGEDMILEVKSSENTNIESIEDSIKYKIDISNDFDTDNIFQYNIYDLNSNLIVENKTSKEILKMDFEKGNYTIIQTLVDNNHIINEKEYNVEIDNENIIVNVENEVKKEIIVLPKTNQSVDYVITLLMFIWIYNLYFKYAF